jgi:hypothetical protein
MRDHVQRSKTTYSSRNAGGAEDAEPAKVCRDEERVGTEMQS